MIAADDEHDRPDLIRRDFTACRPGERLLGEITYLRTGEGWLYLATLIDLHNREAVGWSMAAHMRTELISDALRMAHVLRRIEPGAIFHSDRGARPIPIGRIRGRREGARRATLGRARRLVP